ncbi:hypothetical protein [Marixanthomonas spongiae]|uniref:3-hydroxymyristoyl/3-hydroxydecanoyl-(Acyl carrier protein) dehydratase n=1 Tax=Marixanthomonas spongiae TaxID=2174845 RepID=A0A2U0HZQ5_9FLAO|nr:hypothetical protein [Marixanthomonas spongiae]PVW14309.1 hypothetical protein DDV96_10950 [Marixanthomonas spongiae]
MKELRFPITDPFILEELLPQREPMIMVDALMYYDKKSVIAELTVTEGNSFVKDGFLSETGLLEHIAQTVALHTGYTGYMQENPVKEGYIGAIKQAEILKTPTIGQTVETEMEIIHEAIGISMVKTTTKLQHETIATTEMKTMLKA